MYISPIITKINSILIELAPDKILRLTESGWPDRFHAIIEDGSTMIVDYELLFIDEIKSKYKFDPTKIFEHYNKDLNYKL